MARQISEAKSLPLYQVIGAPLLALVQAEVQAAQATAEFIDRVGFRHPTPSPEVRGEERANPAPNLAQQEGPDRVGDLRMVAFRYSKPDATGHLNQFEVQVPLLSLVAIPSIQIKDAQIEFSVQIHDTYCEDIKTGVHDKNPDEEDFLYPSRVGFRTGLTKRDSDYEMKIKINVGQADVPTGLASLFKVLEQGISSSADTKR